MIPAGFEPMIYNVNLRCRVGQNLMTEYEWSLLQSAELDHQVNNATLLTLTYKDPDFYLIESPIFIEEVPLNFQVGWSYQFEEANVLFMGFIASIEIKFPEDGIPTVVVHCMDHTYLMNKEKKRRTWDTTSISSVITQIAGEYGFTVVLENVPEASESIAQDDISDAELIMQLAEDNKCSFFMVNKTIYFRKKDVTKTPTMNFAYKEYPLNCFSVELTIDKANKMEKSTSEDISSDKEYESGESTESENVSGTPADSTSNEADSGVTWTGVTGEDGWIGERK